MASMRRRDSASEMTVEPIKDAIREEKIKVPDYLKKMTVIRHHEASMSDENTIAKNAAKVCPLSCVC